MDNKYPQLPVLYDYLHRVGHKVTNIIFVRCEELLSIPVRESLARSRLHNPLCIVHPVGAGMVLLGCKVHEEKVVSVVRVFVHDVVVRFQDFFFWKDT